MSNSRFSEDLAAISFGSFILVVSLITFVWVPMSTGTESSVVATFLNQSVLKLAGWDINPFNAFSGKGNTPVDYLISLLTLFIVFGLFFGLMIRWMGESASKFLKGFIAVFIVALLANMLGTQYILRPSVWAMHSGPSSWEWSSATLLAYQTG